MRPHPARATVLFAAVTFAAGCASIGPRTASEPTSPSSVRAELRLGEAVTLAHPVLYPETLEGNPLTGKLLVSSMREGAVYEISPDGTSRKWIDDPNLTSVLGIVVDPRSGRLIATNSDLGLGIKRSRRGPRHEAGVGIYDLATGRPLHYVDLAPLVPGEHLINGITVDTEGNAYATDSFAPVIYKIDPAGHASVFLEDDAFRGPGINLNGLVFDPRGFLLVVKKSTGALYRVPLDQPRKFTQVQIPVAFIGGDGLARAGDDALVLVANKTPQAASNSAFLLQSHDGWRSAEVVATTELGKVYPTSCALFHDRIYALSSHLDELLAATDANRDAVLAEGRRAEIREIGTVTP